MRIGTKTRKCDICGEEISIHKLKKFKKSELMKDSDKFIDERLKILEQTNKGFNRKSRICEDCVKKLNLDFSESKDKKVEQSFWSKWKTSTR